MKNGYITLDEAQNLMGPVAFSALTKPIGSLCNLDCTYCYYLDKYRFYGNKQQVMNDQMLDVYIKEYINSNSAPEINFTWHGGEPLLAGIEFFRRVVELQKRHNVNRKIISNAIQTNGTLITQEWALFFRENNFLVGVSIDGPKDIHNAYRKSRRGVDTFEEVVKGINLLKLNGVEFNSLSVVNNLSEGRGAEIYNFLKSIGVEYMQFLPAVDYISKSEYYNERAIIASPTEDAAISNSILAPWSLSPKGYGQFLIDVFNEWLKADVGLIFVQLFDMTLCSWCGIDPPLCAYREVCGTNLAVEHNGDVYSCDHFVFKENLLGNISKQSIKSMLNSPQHIKFALNKRNTLSRECIKCTYYFACKGECPKHRHLDTLDGEKKFTLCEGIKMYYKYTEPYMKYMRDQLAQQKSPANVMKWAKDK